MRYHLPGLVASLSLPTKREREKDAAAYLFQSEYHGTDITQLERDNGSLKNCLVFTELTEMNSSSLPASFALPEISNFLSLSLCHAPPTPCVHPNTPPLKPKRTYTPTTPPRPRHSSQSFEPQLHEIKKNDVTTSAEPINWIYPQPTEAPTVRLETKGKEKKNTYT